MALDLVKESDLDVKLLMHDRDTRSMASFDAVFDQAGAGIIRRAFWSPNATAFVERYIQMLQQEVLDYFVVACEQNSEAKQAVSVRYVWAQL